MEETKIRSFRKTNPLRYAVGMFGTSIPINMFKTYAAFFYVDKLGLIIPSWTPLTIPFTASCPTGPGPNGAAGGLGC